MAGTPIEEFTMLLASQGPAWMRDAETIINEGVRNTYTWPRLVTGKQMEEMIQGGDQIQDTIFFEEKTTFERYNPNASFDYDNHQTGTTWTVPWSFAKADMSVTEHELGLNKDVHTGRYRTQKYKSVMFQKHQNLWTDVCNNIDDEFWAQPKANLMETASTVSPRVPYSIPVFINELSDASDPTAADVSGLPSVVAADWSTDASTIMGINPATKTKWQNQREGYTYNATSDTVSIFNAMAKMKFKTQFDRLPKHESYSDKRTKPHVILTNLQGIVNYENALRVNQDIFRGVGLTSGQDPDYDKPTYNGIPMDYIANLDTAAIYPTGSNAGAYGAWDAGGNTTNTDGVGHDGPRYYFMNGEYLKLVWHSEHYMQLRPPVTPSAQPFSRVQVASMWNNCIARSRQRHGIIYPTDNTSDA